MTIKKRFLRGSVPGCAALAGLGLVISLVQTSVVSAAFAQQSSLKTEALNTLSAPAAAGDSALSPPPAPPELEDAPKSVGAEPVMPDQAKPAAANGENPYGLKALWKNGDAIARSVLLIMAFMSVGSWIIIVMKFIEESRLFRAAKQAAAHFWGQKSVHEGVSYLSEDSPFRYIADSAIAAAEHHEGSMRDSIDLQDWISMSISRAVDTINSRLQGGLAFLGTVGSTSPFIGLFGTVWGIYHALTAIGIAGQASIDKVAGPVGESLIMTAIGLATAVPAVLGYNLLVRRNKACMERVRDFASDVLSVLIGGCTHDDALASVHASLKPAEGQEPPTTITSSSRV